MIRPRGIALGLLVVACAASLSCSRQEPWNVLLVTLDTTRADRIGCYGHEPASTPVLDGLAASGLRFDQTRSAVPITAPSHSTILTGRYPLAHGVRDNGLFVLADDQLTLAEILGSEGYATAAAIGAYPLTSRFGLDQGFDLYDDHVTVGHEDYLGQRGPKDRLFFDERRAAQVNEAIFPWLTENAGGPFFAWVHYFDPHQPFEPPPPYDQLHADDAYDGEIAYADASVGHLLGHLESLGVLDRTLVVVTADHGEGLGEHNETTHAMLAYDSTLRVPFIVRPPGGFEAGRVVDQRVGTVDIVPTILDLLGVPAPDGLQGRSLRPLMEGRAAAARPQYAENLSTRLAHGWGELRVLYDDTLKYIHGPRPELYDLAADPNELDDLSTRRPGDVERMVTRLQEVVDRYAVEGASDVQELDDEVRARLEALGYLHASGGSSGTIIEELRTDGLPPQDTVTVLNDISAAKHLLFEGQPHRALVYTERLLRRDAQSPQFLEFHATALANVGRQEEAWETARRLQAVAVLPEALLLRLAGQQFLGGDQEGALEVLRTEIERNPSPRTAWLLATLHQRRGEDDLALDALHEALEIDEDFAPARVDLAVALAMAGRPDEAERHFSAALESDPFYGKGFYNYGTMLLHEGRPSEAATAFARAIALSPSYHRARLALVTALVADGREEEGRTAYRDLEALAPGSPEAARAAELLAGGGLPGG